MPLEQMISVTGTFILQFIPREYLMKYIEKSGEKIVYSKGLPQYFISDILDEDVVCRIGMEEQKLLLFDNFTCWNEGCYVGEVSADAIKQLRKCN